MPKDDLLYLQKELEEHLNKAESAAFGEEDHEHHEALNGSGSIAKDSEAVSPNTFSDQAESPTPSIEEDYLPPPPEKSNVSFHEEFQEHNLPPESPESQQEVAAGFEESHPIDFTPETPQKEIPEFIPEYHHEEVPEHFEDGTHEEEEHFEPHQETYAPEEHTFKYQEPELEESEHQQEEFPEPEAHQETFIHEIPAQEPPSSLPLPNLLHANEEIEHTDHILESPVGHMETHEDIGLMDNAHMHLVGGMDQFAAEKQEATPLHFAEGHGAGEATIGHFEQESPLESTEHIHEGGRHVADAYGVVINEHPLPPQQPVMKPIDQPVMEEPKPSFEEIKRDLEKKK